MGEVETMLESASRRFERLQDMEQDVSNHFNRVHALLTLLRQAYGEERRELRERVDEITDDIHRLESEVSDFENVIPDLGRQSQYDEIQEVVDKTAFHNCITRDEFIKDLVQSSQ